MNMLWADLGAKAGNPTALDQQLTQLCNGDTSSLELVSKRHESMAFLISLSHLQTILENNGYTLDEDELLGVLNAGDPCKALIDTATAATKRFMSRSFFGRSPDMEKLNELYEEMNVPDLESRSAEYQDMVEAVGRMALKDKPSVTDSIRVYNAVRNYALAKSEVPSSEQGKKSLSLGYEALKAVLPDDADKAQVLLSPLQARMNKLQEAMEKEAAKAKQPEDPYADMPRASNGEIILRGPGD